MKLYRRIANHVRLGTRVSRRNVLLSFLPGAACNGYKVGPLGLLRDKIYRRKRHDAKTTAVSPANLTAHSFFAFILLSLPRIRVGKRPTYCKYFRVYFGRVSVFPLTASFFSNGFFYSFQVWKIWYRPWKLRTSTQVRRENNFQSSSSNCRVLFQMFTCYCRGKNLYSTIP